MSRLPRLTGKKVLVALGAAGFEVFRIKGSHHFLRHADGRITVVPVHDPFLVRGFQRIRNLARDLQGLFEGNCALLAPLRQRRSFNQLHHEVIGTNVIKGADIGMIQRSDAA